MSRFYTPLVSFALKRSTLSKTQVKTVTATTMTTQTQTENKTKREGSIADSFASLAGAAKTPLPQRFLDLKKSLVRGNEDRLIGSWKRLLSDLRVENEIVAKEGPGIVPTIEFGDLDSAIPVLRSELKKRGVAVIRGVIPEDEARAYKAEIEEYVRQNPQTRAFPQNNPQVFELYWSAPQLKARSHPNMMKTQKALMNLWHTSDPESAICISQPLSYADRLRIRQPGDVNFALGPHMDGGSVERWEPNGYGRGGVYDKVFTGNLNEYDPWDASTRVNAVMNNYNGLGACSMFRMFQGWLSMSQTKPGEGTLLVNPLLKLSTAYLLLRPFFVASKELKDGVGVEEYLSEENWMFAGEKMTSELQGAELGYGQELSNVLHPHLDLDRALVHMPEIKPGDFAVWHCDTIHAVDKVHAGKTDSSVLYIPICPLTEYNAKHLVRSRQAFINGTPSPDFPGGKGESEHVNRCGVEYLRSHSNVDGLRASGFEKLVPASDDTSGAKATVEKATVERANEILGF